MASQAAVLLDEYLPAATQSMAQGAAVAAALRALVATSVDLADRLASGHDPPLIEVAADGNGEGDARHPLDALAHQLFTGSLRGAPVSAVLSGEAVDPITLSPDGQVVVALDPIDGSSNVGLNGAIGTLFSILPAVADDAGPHASLLVTGDHQLAAGLVLYGPATVLALTLGAGTDLFVLDRTRATFVLARSSIRIPDQAGTFAINMANRRHWPSLVRRYVDDLLAGAVGVRERDFDMRWVGAVVADALRILTDGGIAIHPGDDRPGGRNGSLRLVSEGNPVALLIEQAGGSASNGSERILSIQPETLHQRTPLIFGSSDEVRRCVERLDRHPNHGSDSPLFRSRGIFRD